MMSWPSKEHYIASSTWKLLGLQPWPPPSSSRTSWSLKGEEMSCGQIWAIVAVSPSWFPLGNIHEFKSRNIYLNRNIKIWFVRKVVIGALDVKLSLSYKMDPQYTL
jgi:hypothetical protein